MADLLEFLLHSILHALTWMLDAIPLARLEEMSIAWAWLASACLAVGFVALVAAACTGLAWLFYSFLGALVAALCTLILGASWPQ